MKEFFKTPEKSHSLKKSAILIGLVLVVGIGAYMLAGSSLFKGSVYIDEMNKIADNVKSYNYDGSYFKQNEAFTNDTIAVDKVSSWEVLAGGKGAYGALFASQRVDGKSIGSWHVLKAGVKAFGGEDQIAFTSVNDNEQNLSSDGFVSNIKQRCIYIDRNFDGSFSSDEEEKCFVEGDVLPVEGLPYIANNLVPASPYEVAVLIEDSDGRKDWDVQTVRTRKVIEGTGPVIVGPGDPATTKEIDPLLPSAAIKCRSLDHTYLENSNSVNIEWEVSLDLSQFDPALNEAQDNWSFEWDLDGDNYATIEDQGVAINHDYTFAGADAESFIAHVRVTSKNGDDPAYSTQASCILKLAPETPVETPEETPVTPVDEPQAVVNNLICKELFDERVVNADTVQTTFKGFYDTVPEITAVDAYGNYLWTVKWRANNDSTNVQVDNYTSEHPDDLYTVTFDRPESGLQPQKYKVNVSATHQDGTSGTSEDCYAEIPAKDPVETPTPEEVPADVPAETVAMDIRMTLVESGGSFYEYPGFDASQEMRVYGIFRANPSANGAIINDANLNWTATYRNSAGEIVELDSKYIITDANYPGTQNQIAANEVLMSFPTPSANETFSSTISVNGTAEINGSPAVGSKSQSFKVSTGGLTFVLNEGGFIDNYVPYDGSYYDQPAYSFELPGYSLENLNYFTNSVLGSIEDSVPSYDVVYADIGSSVFFKPNCDASALDGAVRITAAGSLPDGEKGVLQEFYKANLFGDIAEVAVFDIQESESCKSPEKPVDVPEVTESGDLSLDCTVRKTDDGRYEEVLTVTTSANPHAYAWEYTNDATPNLNGDIDLSEAPVDGQKIRQTTVPKQGSFYGVTLTASTTTSGDLKARTTCEVPKVKVACSVDADPVADGEDAGKYQAWLSVSAPGFDMDNTEVQWKQTFPVQSQSDISIGVPSHRNFLIDPEQGYSTTEVVEVRDAEHGLWDATTTCKIPPKISCEQDAGGNARITTYGIESSHYMNGYKWLFGDEEETPADPDSYYSDRANYDPVDFASDTTPSHQEHGHSYDDTKSHTVNLYMQGVDEATGEDTYTALTAACPGDDAPVIDAVDDPEIGVNPVDSFDTLQGNPISVYILENDTFNAAKLDTVAWPVMEVPAQDSPDFNQDARYVTVEIIKNEPEYEINGQAFLGVNVLSPGIVDTIEYTPDPDFTGLEEIKYRITDVESGVSDTAIVRINVKPAEPTGSLACTVDGAKAVLTANFDRNEAFGDILFAVLWYQDGELFDVNMVTAEELDAFIDKKVEYEHNSSKNFSVSMVIIPVNNVNVKPVAIIDGDFGPEEMIIKPTKVIDVSLDPADLENLLHYQYDADCIVPEDVPVPNDEKPVPPSNGGENYCSIVNTNTNISDSDINQSEQSVDCSVNINIDNSVTNYYYYPEGTKETVVVTNTPDNTKTVDKIPVDKKDTDQEKTEVKEEIAATGDVKTEALTCYKPGETKKYLDADKFGYYKRFVEEFTKIDAVSPGDYKKGTTELNLTPKPIVKGYADNNFKVFSNATRTEGLKMISNGTCLFQDLNDANILSLDDQAKKDAAAVYKDFPSDHWAKIMAGVTSDDKVEMTQGYKDGTFRPDQPITKAEYGKILVARFCVQQPDECDSAKAKIKKESEPFKDRFPDLVGHWGGGKDGWITLGNELNIILGTTDGKFYPDTYITRGDALVLLHNYVVARGLLDDLGNIVKIETKITR